MRNSGVMDGGKAWTSGDRTSTFPRPGWRAGRRDSGRHKHHATPQTFADPRETLPEETKPVVGDVYRAAYSEPFSNVASFSSGPSPSNSSSPFFAIT